MQQIAQGIELDDGEIHADAIEYASDMRELGEVSEAEHQKVVDTLKAKGLNDVWLVGEEFGQTRCDFHKYNNVEEVKQAIASYKPCGKCILIKGSNGTKLFELPELL